MLDRDYGPGKQKTMGFPKSRGEAFDAGKIPLFQFK